MLIMWLRVCVFATCAAMALGCGFPGAPAHSSVTFSTDSIRTGTVATYSCDRGFELLGPSRKECTAQNSTWQPPGIPFCVINVAAGKAPMQSSTAQGGVPQKAVDGSTSGFFSPDTCTLTEQEVNPYWYVNLLEPYMVQLVRLDFGRPCCDDNQPATVVVRVGNNRPDLKINPICNRFTGYLEEGRPLFLPCNPPMPGAFVSVHIESPPGQMLSICEAFVYTDQALPIERCPQFRDQPPGSTATYNGKCYTFYNQGALDFAAAQDFCQQRQGSLITETNPALQGFLSWELWRRHRDDPTGQYWMGAVRDPQDATSWTWIDGQPVGVSFWSLPGGSEDCARFDGTKDWLWSDTDCRQQLYYICQHQPLTCGRPEQPPNSTLVASGGFEVDSEVQYRCQDGHLLVGPEQRTCLDTGFYSGYAPTCKNLQCGAPANIDGGSYSLVNGSRGYMAMVEYTCDDSYVMVGRHQLICDVDERWNGPPPHCEPSSCDDPPQVLNGQYRLSTNSTVVGTVVEYFCIDDKFELVGPPTLRCLRNGTYDADAPICRADAGAGAEVEADDDVGENAYGRPEENEIPDTVNIRQNSPPGISVPDNTLGVRVNGSRLNIGGIIALGVFGGFVFLAAVITSVIIIAKRNSEGVGHSQQRRIADGAGRSSGYSTESEVNGLNKYYKRAWDNLQASGRHQGGRKPSPRRHRHHTCRSGDEDSELGYRPSGDDGKRRHHHHHHHRSRNHRSQERGKAAR